MKEGVEKVISKILNGFINLYAVWIILAFVVGFFYPNVFLWFTQGNRMTLALALVMLCMGLTLKVSDFVALFRTPKIVVIAAAIHYTVMPLSGWLIVTVMKLPTPFAVGFLLLASCPAGTASNMIAYIARANVALSVISTAVSTLLAIVLTPVLTKLLAGQYVRVDAWAMFLHVAQLVLLPVSLGLFINYKFPRFVKKLGQTGPVISTWAIVFISGGIIAPAVIEGKDILIDYAGTLLLAATLLHSLGFALGYFLARVCNYENAEAKAISCETGMQNGGLAAVLARNSFPALVPLVAVPAVFCSVMQTVIGGIIASVWRYRSRPVGTDIQEDH